MPALISDSDPKICTVANVLVRFEPELAVVGKAWDDARLVAQSKYRRPDPILLDLATVRQPLGRMHSSSGACGDGREQKNV